LLDVAVDIYRGRTEEGKEEEEGREEERRARTGSRERKGVRRCGKELMTRCRCRCCREECCDGASSGVQLVKVSVRVPRCGGERRETMLRSVSLCLWDRVVTV
jgi:hypothetical protein